MIKKHISNFTSGMQKWLGTEPHHLQQMPIVLLMPHSACNCKCVMCDIWKSNKLKREISADTLSGHIDAFERLGVRWVVLTGGEALLHTNLWQLCQQLKALQIKITLLSTGLTLAKHADKIVQWCDEVIVSIDGTEAIHDEIRRVPGAYERLKNGIAAIRKQRSDYRITGRCVLQSRNYFALPDIITTAHTLRLDNISFLAVDSVSSAFNRTDQSSTGEVDGLSLNAKQVDKFEHVLEQTITQFNHDFRSGFIVESPQQLRRFSQYFKACIQDSHYPKNVCNAPWVSAVIEADGTVRPCFFHQPIGNIYDDNLLNIINSDAAVAFRETLDVQSDETCKRCVCSLNLNKKNRNALL